MPTDDWHRKLETMRQQVEMVRGAIAHPAQWPGALQEAVEVLQGALEALHAAAEERRQQQEVVAVAQQATAAMHQRYQALFDCATDGYLVTDSEGRIQEANRAAAALLGLSQEQLVGTPLLLFVPQEERSSLRTHLTARDTVQRRQDWEVHLQPQGGPPFMAALTVAALENFRGTRAGLLWLLRDVTARQQAEAALRDSEARNHAILQTAVDGIITIDEQGHIESFNQAAERLFDYSADEVIGHNVSMLMPVPYRDEHDGYLARYRQTGEPHIIGIGREVRGQRRDGTTFPIALAVSEVYLGDRRLFTGIVHDLSARAQAEEALRASEAFYRNTLDTMLEGCQIIGFDWRYRYLNDTATQHARQPKAALLGHTTMEIYPGFETTEAFARLRQCMEERTVQQWDTEFVFPDGTRRWFQVRAQPVPEGLLVLSVDLTERKRLEQELLALNEALEQRIRERTAALQEANDEIRRFAYIVSHDLRAPLINLHGFADELRDACAVLTTALPALVPHLEGRQGAEVTRAIEADIPEALGFIETSVTRMDRLIEAVLQLSRLGRQALQRQPIATEAVVHETLRTLAHQIAQRQVQVTVGPLPVVHVDHLALAQIFGNLLANTVAYLEPGRPGEIAITATQHPGVTVFAVRDNGRGIAADDIPRVFEPFRRVGRQDVPGEGMGLAYVRTLVRRHGGDITCQSTLGVGTTFTFTMPHALPAGTLHA